MSERIGTSERIQDWLNNYCVGGYSNGTIGTANQRYLLANYPEFVRVYRVYRLGDALEFVVPELGRGLGKKFAEFCDDLAGLDDYPMIDESTYQELCDELESDAMRDFCVEHKLDESVAWDVLSDGDWYWYDTDGMADIYGMSLDGGTDVEFVNEVRKRSQSWAVHYEGAGTHYAEYCPVCADVTLPSSVLVTA